MGFCGSKKGRFLLTRSHEDAAPSGKAVLSNQGRHGLIRGLARSMTSSWLRVRIKLHLVRVPRNLITQRV